MGAIADYAAYKAASPRELLAFTKNNLNNSAGRFFSMWQSAPLNGVAPTTAVVPTRATVGSVGQQNPSSNLYFVGADVGIGLGPTCLFICDRLSHQAGLVANIVTSQTTNLPTAALTRYTSGEGVWAALEVYSTIGASTGACTVVYTNQAGTGGRTTPTIVLGNTGFRETGRMIILPLQDGDTGVRSVESVQLSVSTGTAANMGITLFRPLVMMSMAQYQEMYSFDSFLHLAGNAPSIVTDACLWFCVVSQAATTGVMFANLRFIEA